MDYIVCQRFRGKAICGENVNLPYGSKAEADENGLISMDGKPICYERSQNAHDYFARDDDGNGLARGELVKNIMKTLKKDQDRWNRVWEDEICQQYRRVEHKDYWLWNHDFFNADLEDLKHIAALVGAKGA